ncbi:MAG: cell division protein FtsL [Pseudohongiellaceae bacterium]
MNKFNEELKGQNINGVIWLVFFLCLILVCSSALAVIYAVNESRHLLNELQILENKRNALQVEWGQLLLEQSSLVSQGRVEDIAITELGMKIPAMENMVMVRQ